MAQTVIIDIEAHYRDKTAPGVSDTTEDIDRMRKKLEETEAAGKKANVTLEKILSTVAQFARKTISIPVKILDYATKPLRSLLNYATSLKGILTGLVVGQVGQMLIANPLGLADQYSNAYIGFKTLFNSEARAQQMMDDLDEFARTTPYKTSNVIAQTQKMLAMGWDANRLIQDMTIIGDAAAATGKGDEGLERIVLSLAQIKSKGKLSTEELNQLAEAGINAKAYVAEGLGYGTGDAAQQQLSKALEGGKIGGNAAVEMILAGMQKNYSGMMESIAQETVEGIKSNIEDTFEINIFRKWGQGLQEGAKRGLGSMADMLDKNQERLSALGDKLQEIGADLSNGLADAAEDAIGKAMDIMESEAFDRATIPGKAKLLWDNIIAEPFNVWWESDGQKFVGDVAGKIGTGLGKFYNGAITTILGIDADGAAEGGVNIGAKFAEGFLEGFNAESVWDAIKKAFSNAMKIVPGGEEATASSWLSAALLGYGGVQIAGIAKPVLSGAKGIGSAAVGSQAAAEAAIILGAGNLAGNASLSAGALSALGVGTIAGGAIGGMGLISGMADLTRALNETSTTKEANVSGWSAGAKFGMVGTGAALGAGIGSIVPVIGTGVGALLGAGIGGLGALLAGGNVGEGISDLLDGTGKIRSVQKAIKETGDSLADISEKTVSLEALKSKYEELTEKIEDGTLGTDELKQVQSDLADTIQALADLYPDLITQYDAENGKLSEKLTLIRDITEEERKQARRESQMAVYEGQKQLPELESKIRGSEDEQDEALRKYDELIDKAQTLEDIMAKYRIADAYKKSVGDDSAEYKAAIAEASKALEEYNRSSGNNYFPANLQSGYDRAMESAGDQLEKAKAAGAELEEFMATYQEIYQGFLQNAMNPESLDAAGGLSAVLSKIEEIQAVQEERASLEEELSKMDKGSKDYDTTAKKIEEAKERQDELVEALEPFKGALEDVLTTIEDINKQFDLLGGKRLDFSQMGLGTAAKYIGYSGSGIQSSEKGTSQVSLGDYVKTDAYANSGGIFGIITRGFASGTKYAPPGLAWVGENGPELMSLRGGERIYNTADSMRIAAETARSTNRIAGVSGGVQVNLGGMSISITGGGDSRDILEQLQDRLPELGNQLCAMIATQLSRSYANMPTTATEGI